MCTDEQHQQKIAHLARIDAHLHKMCDHFGRDDINWNSGISSTQPLIIDYRHRFKLYLWSPIALVFSMEDTGNITIPAQSWTEISFLPGLRLTPLAQSSTIQVFLRATDHELRNPAPLLGNIQEYTLAGQAFIGNTGLLNLAANSYPLSVFNPATSGKTIILYAVHGSASSAGSNGDVLYLQTTTSDPAYANAVTPVNAALGAALKSVVSCTYAATNTGPNTPYLQAESSAGPIELLSNGAVIVLPAGSANGVTAYMQTFGSGFINIVMKWIEI